MRRKNTKTPQSQEEYLKLYNGYVERYQTLNGQYEKLMEKRAVLLAKADTFQLFIRRLRKQKTSLSEFDDRLWQTMVDRAVVEPDGRLRFRFCNGMEIES